MKKIDIRTLSYLAVLMALEIVLSRFLSFSVWNMKIGFSFVPVVVAAMLLGPVPAGIVAALGDFLGAILFPIGPYFPGFTVTAFLTGLIFGLFLYHHRSVARIFAAVGINQLVLSYLVNSYWISVLYDAPYLPLLGTRILQCAVLIPVQIVMISLLGSAHLQRIVRKGATA